MLTRLRVQGFKNLLDLEVYFGPFTCIAGPNGAGKSNLFDAIRFLNLLTQHPIMEAVQKLRETGGRSPDPRSLFTTFEGYTAPEMRFSADLIVERKIQDDFGVSTEAAISTLRYEVAFRVQREDGTERLILVEEWLRPITLSEARGSLGFNSTKDFRSSCITGRRTTDFISTHTSANGPEIRIHQDGQSGRNRSLPAMESSLTVIGGVNTSDFPTILAARREMQSWQTLLLEPSAMRAPSYYDARRRPIDPRGSNLPASIARLQKEELHPDSVCTELANRLSELIEDVQELRVHDDPKSETLTLEVRGRNGVFLPARSLSDGTLRFLVLATLAQDPKAKGVICLEEPENGIHPERIPVMVQLLKDIAVDAKLVIGDDNPLRQVVVNTHSPEVFCQVSPKDDLMYIEDEWVTLPIQSDNGKIPARGSVASVKVPRVSWRTQKSKTSESLSEGRVSPYLRAKRQTKDTQGWLDFVAEDRISQ
ncbi:MAG TPA: AAA family ATPase [Candidatus Hydrogenedentes bacterium]|nr:AAA family ATPase [Candidatus Hydrogenedentota bacterium]